MMAISTKGRYAARIMVFLTQRRSAGPVTKKDIAAGEGISADYVEQIMIRLKAAGLVASIRGRKGGFVLGRDPERVSLYDVLESVEGPLSLSPCVKDGMCRREQECPLNEVWRDAATYLINFFSKVTVEQLANSRHDITEGQGGYGI